MNALYVFVFACLAAFAAAKPSGLWQYGGPLTLVGASGVVSSNGAAGPAGVVTGRGAIGPNGISNAVGHIDVGLVGDLDDGQWRGEGLLESQDWAGRGGVGVIAPGSAVLAHGGLGLVNGLRVRGLGLGVSGLGLGVHGLGVHGQWW